MPRDRAQHFVQGVQSTQYFERARFEYDSGLEGTPYAVQLAPIGYLALRASGFNLPMGTLASFNPPIVAEGHTTILTVGASAGVTVTGQYEGRPLLFTQRPDKGTAWTLIGAVPFADLGPHTVTVNLQNADGGKRTITIPAPMAYGSAGAGAAVPPNAALVFEIELLSVS